MMFRQNGLWLGQVRLVARPAMGTFVPEGAEPYWQDKIASTLALEKEFKASLPAQPKDAKSPGEGCLFLGMLAWSDISGGMVVEYAAQEQQGLGRLTQDAIALGYDVIEVNAPNTMCSVRDPNRDPNLPMKLNEVPATAPCYEAGSKFVWACPRPQPVLEPISAYPGTQTLPPGPKPDLVPVAAGAGVVAILAAVIAGAFGK